MRAFGVTYDTGFRNAGTTTHEPFDPDVVAREMRIIRDDLHCDAIRITGSDADRLEVAARHAAAAGLEVWYCPFTNDLTQAELMTFLADAAERAERIRQEGTRVVFLTGSEISLFTLGFLPGDTLAERWPLITDLERIRALIPVIRTQVQAFLAEALAAVRKRFGGPVSYASLPMEGVDWTGFDIIATDAGYRDETNAPGLAASLAAFTSQGKPFAVTEFGCTTHRGSAAIGGRDGDLVEFDDRAHPIRLRSSAERDEQEQAGYLRKVIDLYDAGGVDTAFVHTFASRHLPTSSDPERDYDRGSYGIVKTFEPGRTGTTYLGMPWEPKAAFYALAEYGRARRIP